MKKLMILLLAVLASACGGSDNNFSIGDQEQAKVEVFIDDGAIQCISTGVLPEVTAQSLLDNGIEVFDSSCAFKTGVAIAAVCGLGDTGINVHTINVDNLNAAINLGFSPVSDLEFGYEVTDCE